MFGVGQGVAQPCFQLRFERDLDFARCVGGCAGGEWQVVAEGGSVCSGGDSNRVRQIFHLPGLPRGDEAHQSGLR